MFVCAVEKMPHKLRKTERVRERNGATETIHRLLLLLLLLCVACVAFVVQTQSTSKYYIAYTILYKVQMPALLFTCFCMRTDVFVVFVHIWCILYALHGNKQTRIQIVEKNIEQTQKLIQSYQNRVSKCKYVYNTRSYGQTTVDG